MKKIFWILCWLIIMNSIINSCFAEYYDAKWEETDCYKRLTIQLTKEEFKQLQKGKTIYRQPEHPFEKIWVLQLYIKSPNSLQPEIGQKRSIKINGFDCVVEILDWNKSQKDITNAPH